MNTPTQLNDKRAQGNENKPGKDDMQNTGAQAKEPQPAANDTSKDASQPQSKDASQQPKDAQKQDQGGR